MIDERPSNVGRSGQRRRVAVLAWLLLLITPFAWSPAASAFHSGQATIVTNPADFRAFYCAARTLASGSDPYLTEPLRACEQAAARAYGLRMLDRLVFPAPLPPFAPAIFEPIGWLPFKIASPLWLVLSLSFCGAAAILTAKLTRFPLLASLARRACRAGC